MKPLSFLYFLQLVACFSLRAQSSLHKELVPPVKQIEIVGDSIRPTEAFFIGEVHGIWEGTPFKFEMIRWLHKKYGITDVVMEWGKSEAYQFNAYLQHGDTAIFAYYGREKKILDQLAQWQALYDECRFTLHGIDFERTIFVSVVLSILDKSKDAQNTELYKYLSSISEYAGSIDDDRSGKKESVKIYSRARSIFEGEKEKLRTVLIEGYSTVVEIMENPATQKKFKQRDAMMALNLANVKTSGSGFICIMGMGHTTLHKNSVLKRYTGNDPGKKVAIVDMVCKNCYTTSYFRSMTIPMMADYEGKNDDYMSGVFDKYYKPGFYSLVNQREFKDLPGGYNEIPTYYVLFKDQPKW